MRLVRTLIVIALVGILPAVSWFYLSKGADWRRSGLEEIAERTHLDIPPLRLNSGQQLVKQDFFGKYAIAVDASAGLSAEIMNRIIEQFGVRDDMRFLAFGEGSPVLSEPWLNIPCATAECASLRAVLFADNTNGALIDDSLQMRRRYDLTSQKELNKLIEHGAIILPTEKREKIDLIRGQ